MGVCVCAPAIARGCSDMLAGWHSNLAPGWVWFTIYDLWEDLMRWLPHLMKGLLSSFPVMHPQEDAETVAPHGLKRNKHRSIATDPCSMAPPSPPRPQMELRDTITRPCRTAVLPAARARICHLQRKASSNESVKFDYNQCRGGRVRRVFTNM